MATVHLIDGTYELFRTWFALPAMKAPDGREVGATRGMLRSLATWLRRGEVTHAAVAFDHVVESFRNTLFDGYKTGDGLDPDLLAQFPLAERATAALGLVTWPMVELEADDAIASGAARFADDPGVERIVLCSPDKDLGQCVVSDRVVVWDRFRDLHLDEDGVRAKFGVPPASIPDYLALVGDAADGIPGIARWGRKSAATLLSRYGRIEDIPDDVDRWDVRVRGARGLAEALASHRGEALLYKRLATLRTDAPIGETLDDLAWRGPDARALHALCAEIGEDADALRL
ncbi:MAG: 5'-3' exonuclease [Myxococcota bacterium]